VVVGLDIPPVSHYERGRGWGTGWRKIRYPPPSHVAVVCRVVAALDTAIVATSCSRGGCGGWLPPSRITSEGGDGGLVGGKRNIPSEWHRFRNPCGFGHGFSWVRVRVRVPGPMANPYPPVRVAGLLDVTSHQ